MWINPNNHALDGGRASSAMEKEAVAEIAAHVRLDDPPRPPLRRRDDGQPRGARGWRAGSAPAAPSPPRSRRTTRTSGSAACSACRSRPSRATASGRLDRRRARAAPRQGDVGTVVATIGTTATGSVDPLPELLALRDRYGFRLHADAAYGGYFGLADNLAADTRRAFDRLGEADSIVIDPHKHGLQPYGCGCVLFRDPAVGPVLQARFAVHVLQLDGAAPGRDQPRMLAARGGRRGALGDAAAAAARAGRRVRPACWTARRDGGAGALRESPRRPAVPGRGWRRSWTSSSGRRGPRERPKPRSRARQIFAEAAQRGLHLALAELPAELFDLAAAGSSATATPSPASARS